jgi:hypothetical protein
MISLWNMGYPDLSSQHTISFNLVVSRTHLEESFTTSNLKGRVQGELAFTGVLRRWMIKSQILETNCSGTHLSSFIIASLKVVSKLEI